MLSPLEIERARDAYSSDFYRRLMDARQELSEAIEELDDAIALVPHPYDPVADAA